MTRPSTILICPTVPLHQLPPAEQDVLRRFFSQHVRGVDQKHHKRWIRFVRDLWRAEPGEGFQLARHEERGGPYHRMHRAFLQRLFDSQERFADIDRLHDWVKTGAGFVTWAEGPRTGKPVPSPRSTAFDVCSEDEMREFHHAAVTFLHEPRSQRRLWPHLNATSRAAALEAVLRGPTRED